MEVVIFFLSFSHFIISLFFNYFTTCLCTHITCDVCGHLHGPERGLGAPGARSAGGYQPSDMDTVSWIGSSARSVHILNCWVITELPGLLFLRWIKWYCDEKVSIKQTCFLHALIWSLCHNISVYKDFQIWGCHILHVLYIISHAYFMSV